MISSVCYENRKPPDLFQRVQRPLPRYDDYSEYRKAPLVAAIVASWLIAFFEYWRSASPAEPHRLRRIRRVQLKIVQEAITLCVFVAFARVYLGEKSIRTWNCAVSFPVSGGRGNFRVSGQVVSLPMRIKSLQLRLVFAAALPLIEN